MAHHSMLPKRVHGLVRLRTSKACQRPTESRTSWVEGACDVPPRNSVGVKSRRKPSLSGVLVPWNKPYDPPDCSSPGRSRDFWIERSTAGSAPRGPRGGQDERGDPSVSDGAAMRHRPGRNSDASIPLRGQSGRSGEFERGWCRPHDAPRRERARASVRREGWWVAPPTIRRVRGLGTVAVAGLGPRGRRALRPTRLVRRKPGGATPVDGSAVPQVLGNPDR